MKKLSDSLRASRRVVSISEGYKPVFIDGEIQAVSINDVWTEEVSDRALEAVRDHPQLGRSKAVQAMVKEKERNPAYGWFIHYVQNRRPHERQVLAAAIEEMAKNQFGFLSGKYDRKEFLESARGYL